MVPIEPWRNSTPLFGAVAFCTTKIGYFRPWFKDAIATLSFDWNLVGCKLGPGKELLKYWAAAQHSRPRRQLYQLYSQLDTCIWSPWNLEHDHHNEYGSRGSLTGFLFPSRTLWTQVLLSSLYLAWQGVNWFAIWSVILNYCWAGQGMQGSSTRQQRWSCHPP